jgi:hypothetical protein
MSIMQLNQMSTMLSIYYKCIIIMIMSAMAGGLVFASCLSCDRPLGPHLKPRSRNFLCCSARLQNGTRSEHKPPALHGKAVRLIFVSKNRASEIAQKSENCRVGARLRDGVSEDSGRSNGRFVNRFAALSASVSTALQVWSTAWSAGLVDPGRPASTWMADVKCPCCRPTCAQSCWRRGGCDISNPGTPPLLLVCCVKTRLIHVGKVFFCLGRAFAPLLLMLFWLLSTLPC